MQAVLYQFPVSHYCEKARWALDYKHVAYRAHNLLVGLHFRRIRRMAADSTVPVLSIDGVHIQGSDRIIDYLDTHIPGHALTPQDTAAGSKARKWEQFADKNLGEPLRLIYYHSLLEHPSTVIASFTREGPWYGPLFYHFSFNRLRRRIREAYRINERTARLARRVVDKAFVKLNEHLTQRPYLIGNTFTRADLSLAALLSPLVRPAKGYRPPLHSLPADLSEYRGQFVDAPFFQWVNRMYEQHR